MNNCFLHQRFNACLKTAQAQAKVAALQENSTMLQQQVQSLKGMVSSSESQQAENAKTQMQKINALQEQVASLKASADKAESECTSVQSQLAESTRKEQEVGVLMLFSDNCLLFGSRSVGIGIDNILLSGILCQ